VGLNVKLPRRFKMTERYEDTGANIGRLVKRKNSAYGDSFTKSGEILKLLYPNGVKLGEYKTLLAMYIAGYAILMIRQEEEAEK
jgi:hypothetical protein